MLVICALQANHISNSTCELTCSLFAYYILTFITLYYLLHIYIYIYCDVLRSVQWESDRNDIMIMRPIHL